MKEERVGKTLQRSLFLFLLVKNKKQDKMLKHTVITQLVVVVEVNEHMGRYHIRYAHLLGIDI
jgi:hypothetical protein